MLLHDLVRRSAARAPDAVALLDASGAIGWGRLEAEVNRAARALLTHGVRRGDRVVLALENSIEFAVWYFGVMTAGAIAVPLAHGPRSDRFAHVVADSTPRACVTDRPTALARRDVLAEAAVPALFVCGAAGDASEMARPGLTVVDAITARAAMPGTDPGVRSIDVDLAAIIYTSGSTGEPRGVMLSHLNLTANADSIVAYLRLTAADRVMAVLPFHYIYGLSLLHTHAAVGGSVVIDNRFAFPLAVLKGMQEHAVTGFAGVPSTFALLLRQSRLASMSFPSLRYVTQAGGAMPVERIREWRRAVPGVPFYVMYGATEAAARLAYLAPEEFERAPGSVGRAIPNVELVVMTDHGTVAACGEIGEVVARGSNISPGYWRAPEATRAVFGPEGYHTGDLGRVDGDGFLHIVGRCKDMLKVGGHRIGPKEIEDVLHAHPAVHEAAVIGTPDGLLGELPVAFVMLKEGRTAGEGELVAYCRSRLASHKVPAHIVSVIELPRNGSGKTDRHALRERAAALHAHAGDAARPGH